MFIMRRHLPVPVVALFVISVLPLPTNAAFGDRIRPITQNPLYFRNATIPSTIFDDHPDPTTELPLDDDSGSPEPGDDDIPGTPVDTIVNGSLAAEAILENGNSNELYQDYGEEDEGKPYGPIELPQKSNETSIKPGLVDIYPLDPPQSILNKDNISSSDTYDNYHYAVPPYVSPYDKNKVVFLSALRPQPGSEHHHSRHPVVKKIVRVTDVPVYRDSGPRIRYIKKSMSVGRHAVHKYPMSHHHLEAKTMSGRAITHPHEFHHHPDKDAKFYGYIPGIPGKPWKDYPLYYDIPRTGFDCKLTKYPGFYADIDAGCQVWHYCQLDGRHDKFLCPNGTVFNQATRVCDWWFNVDCPSSLYKYNINADMYRTTKTKKVLHIHPGKKPHIHKIPKHGKGVYVFTGLGGSRTRPISLSRKVHKHHFMHHPRGRYSMNPRSHPHSKTLFQPGSSLRPHFMSRLPKADHHSLSDGHHHEQDPTGRSIHHLTGGLPVHPASHHHRPYPPGVVRVRKVVVPHHLHHTIQKESHFDRVDHSLHHIPISDPLGRIPHHGHLILHHHQKAKKK